jgi:hypothetical protein
MKIYRDLFFNNIKSLLGSNFPVIRALYGDDEWSRLIRAFYSEHKCQTPLFPEVAKEFLRYLQDIRGSRPEDPGFLLELAHYEWVELALSIDERDTGTIDADPEGDLLREVPVLSPLAWPLSYRYPVHRIRPDYRPAEPPPEPTHLLVYRGRDGAVKFMQLNHVSRLLLQFMQEDPAATGRSLLRKVSEAIGHNDPETVISKGSQLLEDLRRRGVLIGTRR